VLFWPYEVPYGPRNTSIRSRSGDPNAAEFVTRAM
jgi:hypothetical protein